MRQRPVVSIPSRVNTRGLPAACCLLGNITVMGQSDRGVPTVELLVRELVDDHQVMSQQADEIRRLLAIISQQPAAPG